MMRSEWLHDLPIRRKLVIAIMAASLVAALVAVLAVLVFGAATGRPRTLGEHGVTLGAVLLALVVMAVFLASATQRLIVTPVRDAEQRLREHSRQLEARVEKRTRELADAQQQLLRQERLAFLGQLAGGVSHELRRPLSTIGNSLYYLKTVHAQADDDTQKHLEVIRSQIHGMDKIIHDLLDSLRVRPQAVGRVELAPWLTGVVERHAPPAGVTVRSDVDAELPAAWMDPAQMEQVLSNLVTNAYQAMPNGGELRVRAEAAAGGVALSVADTGCGIPERHLASIFEPLFTTKPRGIGLGLTISKNFVEANGGRLEVVSAEGRGTTITVHLPTDPSPSSYP